MHCSLHCCSVGVVISNVSYICNTCFIIIICTIFNVRSEDYAVEIAIDVDCPT